MKVKGGNLDSNYFTFYAPLFIFFETNCLISPMKKFFHNSTLYYVLKDHLGWASIVTNPNGNIVGEQRYREAPPTGGYPFGETRWTSGTMLTDKLFTDQREIADLGIYHYGARFYSPTLGRFLSPDTIIPSYANPQSLNRFSYVTNNPLRYTDPTGHRQCEEHAGTCLSEKQETKKNEADRKRKREKADRKDGGIGPITDSILAMPFTSEFYSNLSTGLDVSAWLIDIYAAGVVTYGGIYGAGITAPFIAVGAPEVPVVTGVAGAAIAELAVQPALNVANFLALGSTFSAVIADTKAGNTRIEQIKTSPMVANSIALTAIGFANKEAYISLTLQSIAVSNDFGWTSLPWK
jgi:RHS repeat-associated protein